MMTPYTTGEVLSALQDALAVADEGGGTFGICIVDDGGHVLLHLRQPDATVAAADSALTKAHTAVWLGSDTAVWLGSDTAVWLGSDTGALPATSPVVPALAAGVPWPLAVFPAASCSASKVESSAPSAPSGSAGAPTQIGTPPSPALRR